MTVDNIHYWPEKSLESTGNLTGGAVSDCEDDADFAERFWMLIRRALQAPFVLEEFDSCDGDDANDHEQCCSIGSRTWQEEIEQLLREHLNIYNIIWLGGLMDDKATVTLTTWHVSSNQEHVALISSDPEDENYDVLRDNLSDSSIPRCSWRSLEIIVVDNHKWWKKMNMASH